jgi:hypothetical protein
MFDLEPASFDGQTIYDAVEVFDGNNSNAPLLGTFTGNNLPPSITSSSGSMFVKFYSDLEVNGQGWDAIYTSTQNSYCSGSNTLTASIGTISDGSNNNQYANNSDCSWLIQPPTAKDITLTFSAFETEQNNDGVAVYDGVDNNAPLLGQFSGSTIPNSVTSSGGSMFIEFLTDPAERDNGWTANYTSTSVGIEESFLSNNLTIFPNPTNGVFTIQSDLNQNIEVKIMDVSGKQVYQIHDISKGTNEIDASGLSKGVYLLKFETDDKQGVKRMIIN